jgi:Sulfotransferase family
MNTSATRAVESASAIAAERDAYLRQRDEAIGECNELLRQRDEALGERNALAERLARHLHRADMAARRGRGIPVAGTSDKILVFLHLAKTAGVTFTEVLARNFQPDEFLQIDLQETERPVIGYWSHEAVKKALARLPQRERLRAVWGHFRPSVRALLPKPSALFTMLREPVDRVLSAFYYEKEVGFHTIEETPEEYAISSDNLMTRVLSDDPTFGARPGEPRREVSERDFEKAVAVLNECAFVGVTDRFDESLLLLGDALYWSLSDLVYESRNITKERPRRAAIPASTRNAILKCNQYDARLYACAKQLFAYRLKSYCGDVLADVALFQRLNEMHRGGAQASELRQTELRDVPIRSVASDANVVRAAGGDCRMEGHRI